MANLANTNNGTRQMVTNWSAKPHRCRRNVVEQSQSLETGIRLIDAIEAKCKSYAQFPTAGIPRDDLGEGRRCFSVGNYVVIYRPIIDGIRVIVVAHGHQDLYGVIRGIPDSE